MRTRHFYITLYTPTYEGVRVFGFKSVELRNAAFKAGWGLPIAASAVRKYARKRQVAYEDIDF